MDQTQWPTPAARFPALQTGGSTCGIERTMAQFMKFGRCMDLIEAAEARDGKPYARVIRTRPDLLWGRDHVSFSLMKPEATIFVVGASEGWGATLGEDTTSL